MSGPEPLVRVVRSGLEESVHLGHVAVCDASGKLKASVGDPERPVFARSSMKPVQAAVSLSCMPDEGLDDREVAIMCASHNGEAVHVEAVERVLARGNLGFADLRCPPGWPLDPESMANAGARRRELHNCSGKHAGKLLACARKGWDRESYLVPGHPLQQEILGAVRRGTGLRDIRIGVDGCGAPVFGMPLSRMATLFARLAADPHWEDLAPHVRRCTGAMLTEPYLVAGRDRIDTAVMEATGDVVVKGGAEGLVCAVSMSEGVGVAIKVHDGSPRADGPALLRVLSQIGLLDSNKEDALQTVMPPVLGGGSPAGGMSARFDLRSP